LLLLFKSLGIEKEGVTLHNLICNIEQKNTLMLV